MGGRLIVAYVEGAGPIANAQGMVTDDSSLTSNLYEGTPQDIRLRGTERTMV